MTALDTKIGPSGGRLTSREDILVVVDDRVPDAEFLLASLAIPAEISRVGPQDDGLERLWVAVARFPRRPLIVICHGGPGMLMLGERKLTTSSLRERRKALAGIGKALVGAPVALFACSVGEGPDGRRFLAMLASALNAPVSASSRPMGSPEKGGSWSFDITVSTDPGQSALVGTPECGPFDPAMLPAYQHLLA